MVESTGFRHVEFGLSRQGTSLEELTIERDVPLIWLKARNGDDEIRFALTPEDRRHLVRLLLNYPKRLATG